jgi:hypothetical protein
MKAYKADLLSGYGVESTKDLTDEQAEELITRLNEMQTNRKEAPPQVRRARSVVLTLLTAMGIYGDNSDWSRVNRYLMDKRIAGKLMYEMDLEELRALARKLRVIHRDQQKKIEQDDYLATNN